MRSRKFLHYTRLTHLYLGVFIAPALIFFAFTGALQTFSLHETTRGSSYKPPAWIVTLAQLHKKQTTIVPQRRLPPGNGAVEPSASSANPGKRHAAAPDATATAPTQNPSAAAPTPAVPASKPHNTLPLKIFFLIVAIGLFVSTISGLYMSWKYVRNKPLIATTFIAGIVVPVVMAIL